MVDGIVGQLCHLLKLGLVPEFQVHCTVLAKAPEGLIKILVHDAKSMAISDKLLFHRAPKRPLACLSVASLSMITRLRSVDEDPLSHIHTRVLREAHARWLARWRFASVNKLLHLLKCVQLVSLEMQQKKGLQVQKYFWTARRQVTATKSWCRQLRGIELSSKM